MKKQEYTLYILNSTFIEGGEVCEGEEENAPYASHNTAYRITTFESVHGSQPYHRMFYDTLEVSESKYKALSSCDNVYVSAIFYSDGDTFGTTDGLYEITGVSVSKEDAEFANKAALKDNGHYKAWEGYFASLIGPEIFLVPFIK